MDAAESAAAHAPLPVRVPVEPKDVDRDDLAVFSANVKNVRGAGNEEVALLAVPLAAEGVFEVRAELARLEDVVLGQDLANFDVKRRLREVEKRDGGLGHRHGSRDRKDILPESGEDPQTLSGLEEPLRVLWSGRGELSNPRGLQQFDHLGPPFPKSPIPHLLPPWQKTPDELLKLKT